MTTTTNSGSTGSITSGSLTPASITLTRRGRLMLLGLPVILAAAAALAVLLMASAALFNNAQASTAERPGIEAAEVEVDPGDTLWSVASAAPTEEDVREVMAQIVEINSLESSQLEPGEVLYVPAD